MWKTLTEKLESSDSFISLTLGLAVVLAIGMLAFNYVSRGSSVSTQDKVSTDQSESGQREGLPATYTVQEGDTLWSIAEDYYKNGFNWTDIESSNNLSTTELTVGQKLTIPPVVKAMAENGQISSASTERLMAKHKDYTVQTGDSLWDIATEEYGTGYQWVEIAKANALANPDIIYAGTKLVLP